MRLLLYICVFSIMSVCGQESKIEKQATPNWVLQYTPEYDKTTLIDQASSFYYLLLDRQYNLEKDQFYCHVAINLLNSEGVQEFSNVSFNFDPSYEKVIIHSLNIIRNGETINKLENHEFSVFQRESNLERHMYDGSLTANVDLSDVRPGDVIDYSYSYIGSNPINEGKFFTKLYFEYSSPLEEVKLRILAKKNRKLNIKNSSNKYPEKRKSSNGLDEYVWSFGPIDGVIVEDNVPSWYDPYAFVEIGDFDKWKDVVTWGSKLYQLSNVQLSQLKRKIPKELASENLDSAITKSIRFVQDDVRYLGFEDGMSAYKPHNPNVVLDNRYGDCKDKSLLLASMLNILGVEAYPMLVNSYGTKTVKDALPSQKVFDHCIVYIKHDDKEVYIDPTISGQGGNWDQTFVPNYEYGLVLNKSQNDIKTLAVDHASKTELKRIYSIDKINGPAKLVITTDAYGGDADNLRSYFGSSSPQYIAQNYLEFQSHIYPSIRLDQSMVFQDHLGHGENHFHIEETYIIDSIFYKDPENKSMFLFDTYPSELRDAINFLSTPERSMPYRLAHPVDFYQETIVNFPEEWSLDINSTHEDNEYYSYDMETSYSRLRKQAKIIYHYQTKKNFVPAEDYADFRSVTENITDYLGFNFTYGISETSKDEIDNDSSSNFPPYLLLLIAGGLGFAFFQNYRTRN